MHLVKKVPCFLMIAQKRPKNANVIWENSLMPFKVPRWFIFWTIFDKIDHSDSESAYPNFSAWFVMAFLEPL